MMTHTFLDDKIDIFKHKITMSIGMHLQYLLYVTIMMDILFIKNNAYCWAPHCTSCRDTTHLSQFGYLEDIPPDSSRITISRETGIKRANGEKRCKNSRPTARWRPLFFPPPKTVVSTNRLRAPKVGKNIRYAKNYTENLKLDRLNCNYGGKMHFLNSKQKMLRHAQNALSPRPFIAQHLLHQ